MNVSAAYLHETPIYIVPMTKPWNNAEYQNILNFLEESWDYSLDGCSTLRKFLDTYNTGDHANNLVLLGWAGRPVGFYGLVHSDDESSIPTWEIRTYLHKDYRRRGISKTLNQSLVAAITEEQKLLPVWAKVREDNAIARLAFWRSFQIEPEIQGDIHRWFVPEIDQRNFMNANSWIIDDLRNLLVLPVLESQKAYK